MSDARNILDAVKKASQKGTCKALVDLAADQVKKDGEDEIPSDARAAQG